MFNTWQSFIGKLNDLTNGLAVHTDSMAGTAYDLEDTLADLDSPSNLYDDEPTSCRCCGSVVPCQADPVREAKVRQEADKRIENEIGDLVSFTEDLERDMNRFDADLIKLIQLRRTLGDFDIPA